jgi:hypothetical protein
MVVGVDHFAQSLLEQNEVKEFIAVNVDPTWLRSVALLASHLLQHVRDAHLDESDYLDQNLRKDRASVFLEIWEESVYPVLKIPKNQQWAEKWRGGHITNNAV